LNCQAHSFAKVKMHCPSVTAMENAAFNVYVLPRSHLVEKLAEAIFDNYA
jgi:hypothetical protein